MPRMVSDEDAFSTAGPWGRHLRPCQVEEVTGGQGVVGTIKKLAHPFPVKHPRGHRGGRWDVDVSFPAQTGLGLGKDVFGLHSRWQLVRRRTIGAHRR
jgi:hypothetical protein